jgi:hypothetical protein
MNKYLSRLTSSQRGEAFNPLMWPSFIATFSYGVGFTAFYNFASIKKSSLFDAMASIHPWTPFVWGLVGIATIIVGFTFLLFNIPPAGKVSGLVGFMVWVFASFCWGLDGNYLLIFSVGLPNLWFWIWQYLSLSLFRKEEAIDLQTMADYNAGRYDDDNGGRRLRETNRGVDRQ